MASVHRRESVRCAAVSSVHESARTTCYKYERRAGDEHLIRGRLHYMDTSRTRVTDDAADADGTFAGELIQWRVSHYYSRGLSRAVDGRG